MSRRRLLEEFDSTELSEALAYDKEYGIPDGDLVAGRISLVTAKAVGGNQKATLADFSLVHRAEIADQKRAGVRMSGAEMMGRMRRITASKTRHLS